ncbi:MAG: hypothetical protein E6Q97_11740 [Desulfurellales bacterium]|nr:MAG: hypothetical protein E6Q97_11740 [Desulfurellales bacterium]
MSDLDTQQLDTRPPDAAPVQRGGLLGYRTLILGLAGCAAPPEPAPLPAVGKDGKPLEWSPWQ